ncbi:NACHT domain-containing protein [Streptomyces anulatus]|uniref:NACHT domain-containing protein n=1 Tax=Streptomyces anulatus TaxID=1892 RepID=UPI0012FECF5C|nr:AAA family ATPase [Streptomyces anulatus]
MAGTPSGPVADFWAELRRLVRQCRVPQTEIADALGLGNSSVSEMLGGQRRKAPDWDTVRVIIELCVDRSRRGGAQPSGASLDPRWWRVRHAELERTSGMPRKPAAVGEVSVTGPPDLPRPVPWLSTADCLGMSVENAVRLLADGRVDPAAAVEALLVPPAVKSEERGDPRILSDLLEQFPARVRAALGVARLALIQAARVVLAAAAVARAAHPGEVRRLVGEVTDGRHLAYRSPLAEFKDAIVAEDASGIFSHYQRLASPLASACPEFSLAAGLQGVAPGADGARLNGMGLAGLGRAFETHADDGGVSPGIALELLDPITAFESPGPQLPILSEGYVNPRFRLAVPKRRRQGELASEGWWLSQPVHESIEDFLATFLLSLSALLAPLVVLGDPGAGKSLLTRLLAARLPAREFRTVRVELRRASAQADLQEQLERALRKVTGRSVTWADWYEREPDVLPVVLLDGFDELLQAGAHRLDSARMWGYLQEIEALQKREAGLGRPLMVIVTSRTVVADRAQIPGGSHVLRLEPFGLAETERWLDAWNRANAGYFARHGLRPLTLDAVWPHQDLAAQPLLLLMLALYDSTDNALHRLRDDDISRTDLYDRLLTDFARRQVDKDGPLPPGDVAAAVEDELHRLSIIAVGMFHRGSQAISGVDVGLDLRALGATAHSRAAMDPALLFGRFFFVHEAQAVVAGERLSSYEFMHATFGEHLTARMIDRTLRQLAVASTQVDASTSAPVDDAECYDLLSFVPLTDRAQVVDNLRDMLADWPADLREHLPTLLGRLFRTVERDIERDQSEYRPIATTRTYRSAVCQANLVLIGALAGDDDGTYASHFLQTVDLMDGWRRCAMLWRSQLSEESWKSYSSALGVERRSRPAIEADEARPDVWIGIRPAPPVDHHFGTSAALRDLSGGGAGTGRSAANVVARIRFAGDADADLLLHAAFPLWQEIPGSLQTYFADEQRTVRSVAQTLIALVARGRNAQQLPELYSRCLTGIHELTSKDEIARAVDIVLRQLVHDLPALPDTVLADVFHRLRDCLHLLPSLPFATEIALFECTHRAVGRQGFELVENLAALHELLGSRREIRPLLVLTQAGLSSSAWEWFAMPYARTAAGLFDDIFKDLNLNWTAARHPASLVAVLRTAADLGLTDWLTEHAARILAALLPGAVGLLRPTDLPHLREALPEGAYAAEFAEIERIWRG